MATTISQIIAVNPATEELIASFDAFGPDEVDMALAEAHDAYDDSQSHPLRLVAYLLNPVGFATEWLIMRPIHFAVSQPQLERVFGHTPHEDPFSYDPYRGEEPEGY